VPWQNFFFHGNDHSDLSVAEQRYFAAEKKWMLEEGAYAMIQSTIPQTLAYALNDSPAGLAAWIGMDRREISRVERLCGQSGKPFHQRRTAD